MKVYISIPITGKDIRIQQKTAATVAGLLKQKGHTPMNPFDVQAPEGLSEKGQYAYYMGEDIKMLLTCDAILMADILWPASVGCQIEHFAANKTGMDIFYRMEDIPNGNKSN